MNGQRRGLAAHHAAAVLSQSDLSAFDLTLAGLAAQLPEDLSDLSHAGGAHRMPLRQQPTTGIHRGTAAQSSDAFIDQAAVFRGAVGVTIMNRPAEVEALTAGPSGAAEVHQACRAR